MICILTRVLDFPSDRFSEAVEEIFLPQQGSRTGSLAPVTFGYNKAMRTQFSQSA
jgi:hypothetical protein